jgi:ABC-type uncharacterized transport system auxiliary subunit
MTAAYLLKGCTEDQNRSDVYELGKFGKADRLVINDAAWRLMAKHSACHYKAQARTL